MPDHPTPAETVRMLQISQPDMAELMNTLPPLLEIGMDRWSNLQRVRYRRIQKILTDVQWNYGPHTNIQTINTDSMDSTQ